MNSFLPTIRRAFLLLICALVGASAAVAQDDSGSGTPGAPPAATAPAEQNNAENPPLSGLDQPVAEPAFGGRSYLVPGVQVSETADSNAGSAANKVSHTAEISRALLSLDMQKIWKQYQLGVDYIGGGDFYAGPLLAQNHGRATQVHTFAADQRILWRTGQLAIRDSFSYLPEGTFGFSSFGGAGSVGSALGGSGAGTGLGGGISGGTSTGSFGGGQYGGSQPRFDNNSIVDIVQGLSPRSTVTLAGGYNFTDYLNVTKSTTGFNIVNSQQTTGQIGYNHLINRRDQIGVQYSFEEFHFPRAGSGSVNAHVWNALYGHRVTGKLNLTMAGGPQLVIIHSPAGNAHAISANGTISFAYTISSRTHLQMMYQRYVTPGSGFYAGANTDAARATLGHALGRRWTLSSDLGYSHNTNLQKSSSTSTVGVGSRTYQFFYAGGSVQRQLSEHFSMVLGYQFNDTGIGNCTGTNSTACGVTSTRQTGMIGINWRPRPIRLD